MCGQLRKSSTNEWLGTLVMIKEIQYYVTAIVRGFAVVG